MKNADSKILLIEFSGNRMKMLLQRLLDLGYTVLTVSSIETAMQKTMTFSPVLILCFEDLGEYTGFQMYNMLEPEIIKKGIPFVLVFAEYSKADIFMGQELGIDAFLFPPFDMETIDNILQSRIRKFHVSKSMSFSYFKKLYELIPVGIFIAENKKIIEANKFFQQITGLDNDNYKLLPIDELFDFSLNTSDKIKLTRFLNGITKSCVFSELNWQDKENSTIKLTLHYLENGTHTFKIVGSVIPLDDHKEHNGSNDIGTSLKQVTKGLKTFREVNYLTRREQEILNLSAEGLPIKIIASQLGISERTVEKHRSNILHKTNTGNIIEALAYIRKQQVLMD